MSNFGGGLDTGKLACKALMDSRCNCAYTTSGGRNTQVDIATLFKVMNNIPETPRIFTMGPKLVINRVLPVNTIFLSPDVAEALEEAMRG